MRLKHALGQEEFLCTALSLLDLSSSSEDSIVCDPLPKRKKNVRFAIDCQPVKACLRKTIEEIREAGIERGIMLAAITSFIDFGPLDYTGFLG